MKKSLLKTLFAKARRTGSRQRVIPRPKKEKPEKPPPKGIVKWLREKAVNVFFPPHPAIQANYALKKGWVFEPPGGVGLILTTDGMKAAWPWATDFFFRSDRRIWEGVCPHGTGHPIHFDPKDKDAGIHGCDGCCNG